MTNIEVARCMLENAISYANSPSVVIANLEYIKDLLRNPNERNEEYDWEDFK